MDISSKIQNLSKSSGAGYLKEQLHPQPCKCRICIDDVRPLPYIPPPRQKHDHQYKLSQTAAFSHIIKKCEQSNHPRIFFVPDMYIIQDSIFCYTNQTGRLRIKQNIGYYQAKKLFEERRKKVSKNSYNSMMTSLSKDKRTKDSNIVVVYLDGSKQIINDIDFLKIFSKRKTDPFWTQASAIYYLPQTKSKWNFQNWKYTRNSDIIPTINKIIEKIGQEVDNYDQTILKDQSMKNNVSLVQNMNMSQYSMQMSTVNHNNINNNINKNYNFNQSKMNISQYLPMNNTSLQFSTILQNNKTNTNVQELFIEIIAYMELAAKNRVLHIDLEYLIDQEGRPYVMRIIQIISVDLKPRQLCYLHDRFEPLENIGEEELLKLKKEYDELDVKILWDVCTEVLTTCLETRKRQLNIPKYTNPPYQSLKDMFTKFFPDFDCEEMLANVNWKNQLPLFMERSKRHITQIIKQDEGISILKRYGVIFYRTFD